MYRYRFCAGARPWARGNAGGEVQCGCDTGLGLRGCTRNYMAARVTGDMRGQQDGPRKSQGLPSGPQPAAGTLHVPHIYSTGCGRMAGDPPTAA
jgi:hypothetical protein